MTVSIQDIKDMINSGMITSVYDLETFCESWSISVIDFNLLKAQLLTVKYG